MFCMQCGKEIPDGSLFCIECGAKVEAPGENSEESGIDITFDNEFSDIVNDQKTVEESVDSTPQMVEEPVVNLQTAEEVKPEQAKTFYTERFVPEQEDNIDVDMSTIPESHKKKGRALLTFLGVAVVLLLAVVIVCKVFGLNRGGVMSSVTEGKITSVVHKLQNTITSGSFKYEINVPTDDGKYDVEGFFNMDPKGKTFEFGELEKVKNEYGSYTYDTYLAIDGNKIARGTKYVNEDYENFNAYNEKLDGIESVFVVFSSLKKKNLENVNYKKLLDEIDEDDLTDAIEDYIKPEDIDNAIKSVLKALDKNAKDLGYKKSKDTISLSFKASEGMEIVLDALENYLDEDVYDDLKDELDEAGDEIDDELGKIKVKIKVSRKYIEEIKITIDDESVTIKISEIGKCDDKIPSKIRKEMFSKDNSYGRNDIDDDYLEY